MYILFPIVDKENLSILPNEQAQAKKTIYYYDVRNSVSFDMDAFGREEYIVEILYRPDAFRPASRGVDDQHAVIHGLLPEAGTASLAKHQTGEQTVRILTAHLVFQTEKRIDVIQ